VTFDPSAVKFDKEGLVPVIAQDERSGDVLMLAWADQTALAETQKTGFLHFHSRTRAALWKKGETSGHVQRLVSLHLDCDGDAILALVHQEGAACHTNAATCFAPPNTPTPRPVLADLAAVIESRKTYAAGTSYTTKLLGDKNLRSKKIGEEATELVLAIATEGKDRIASEAADLLYHVLVACAAEGVPLSKITEELGRRRK
jgi:phosphoribosyl-AMP cyclohydrolase / phosphoribosyl-ATP pyrophosphohydrolase